jgi:hypothetical protein
MAGLARRLAAAAVLIGLVAGCGGSDEGRGDASRERDTRRAPAVTAERPGDGLSIGITEPNPNFVFAPGSREVPEPFARWARELDRMRPALYRLLVDWASLQPEPGSPPRFDAPSTGCMREKHPCAGWNGLRDQLRAVASQQRRGGFQVLVVLAGTPAWAAREGSGCERDEVQPRSRPPRDEALADYRAFVASVLELGREEGAELRYWSPWNEPNHPFHISPQRARCSEEAPTRATRPYAQMGAALKQALDEADGEQELVLGELAGLPDPSPKATGVREFISGLPQELVCASHIWSQHGYVGGPDPVDDVKRGLRRFGCPREHVIWMTETGVGAAGLGRNRSASGRRQRQSCDRLHSKLVRWFEDGRVTAAFQYTLREDDVFPVGLVTTDLTDSFPALQEWQAWGASRRERAQDPPPPPSCGPA